MSPYGDFIIAKFCQHQFHKGLTTNKVSTAIYSLLGRAQNHIFWRFLLESATNESEKLMGIIGDPD